MAREYCDVKVLFLGTEWSASKYGDALANQTLAAYLSSCRIQVCWTVTTPRNHMKQDDVDDARGRNITLIYPNPPASNRDHKGAPNWLNETPKQYFEEPLRRHKDITHIIAFSPSTAPAGMLMYENKFYDPSKTKLILINTKEPEMEEDDDVIKTMVSWARQSSLVFSIGKNMYEYFQHEFSDEKFEHHILLSKCPPYFTDSEKKFSKNERRITIFTFGQYDNGLKDAKGFDIAALAIGSVEKDVRIMFPNASFQWLVIGVDADKCEDSRKYLNTVMRNPNVTVSVKPCTDMKIVKAELKKSVLCLIPSSVQDQFGHAAYQAMGFGTPTLVTSNCGLAGLVNEVHAYGQEFILKSPASSHYDAKEVAKDWSKKIRPMITDQERAHDKAKALREDLTNNKDIDTSQKEFLETFLHHEVMDSASKTQKLSPGPSSKPADTTRSNGRHKRPLPLEASSSSAVHVNNKKLKPSDNDLKVIDDDRDAPIEHKHISYFSKKAVAKDNWQSLARALGLHDKIPDLKLTSNLEDMLYRMVELWTVRNGRKVATVRRFVDILRKEGFVKLAEEIETIN